MCRLILVLFLFSACDRSEKLTKGASPGRNLFVDIEKNSEGLTYSISSANEQVIKPSPLMLRIEDLDPGSLEVEKITTLIKDSLIYPPVASKRALFRDQYTLIEIRFRQPLSLECRIYDEGVAFRWVTRFSREIRILDEHFEVHPLQPEHIHFAALNPGNVINWDNLSGSAEAFARRMVSHPDPFETLFESPYEATPFNEASGRLLMNPILLQTANHFVSVAEAAVNDYAAGFLRVKRGAVHLALPPYPEKERTPGKQAGYGRIRFVTASTPYKAFTSGNRAFPWRTLVISDRAAEIAGSDLVLKLSAQPLQHDFSWVKPGKITDEWSVAINLFGVPFSSGRNTESYKYYVDFVKRFGMQFIMVDEGWYRNNDPRDLHPDINLDSLTSYAAAHGIGVGLWVNALDLDQHLEESLEFFSRYGIKLLLIDFINRADQKAMQFYEKLADATARYKIMINLHGAPPPAGFEMRWPHAITREAVMASEWNGWSYNMTPEHNTTIPFTRMVSGALDYEPGLLENANKHLYRPISAKPMSQGTRGHQLAMYLVYDSPLQYFIGNPSQGHKEPEFMQFLGSLPTTWDETIVLDGEPGKYIVTARKKGNSWYIGAMTNWESRDIRINVADMGLSQYDIYGVVDGINADRYAADYQFINLRQVTDKLLTIHLAKGGGAALKLN